MIFFTFKRLNLTIKGNMPYLTWITDTALKIAVRHLIQITIDAQTEAESNFHKNVVDPFSALFQMAGFNLDFNTWRSNEIRRQSQKTMQNAVGAFHQEILGNLSPNPNRWEDLRVGQTIDIRSQPLRIIAEVKNKWNTVSFGNLSDLYKKLDNLVNDTHGEYSGWKAYYVPIISKVPGRYERHFTPSDKSRRGQRCRTDDNILETDGASFYALVTRDEFALRDLFSVLPTVVRDYTEFDLNGIDGLMELFRIAFSME